jgi:hypothetical protein
MEGGRRRTKSDDGNQQGNDEAASHDRIQILTATTDPPRRNNIQDAHSTRS